MENKHIPTKGEKGFKKIEESDKVDVNLTVRINSNQMDILKEYCNKHNVNRSYVIRYLIENYLNNSTLDSEQLFIKSRLIEQQLDSVARSFKKHIGIISQIIHSDIEKEKE